LSGINQTIVFSGYENSGKSESIFGNLRDPGFIIFAFRDLFSKLYERENCDDYTIKLSFLKYDYKTD